MHIVIKHTPQGMYHDPERTVYHMVAIGKKPDSYRIQIPRKLLETILDLSLSLLTFPLFPPSIHNISWWCCLPEAEANATLSAVSMGLYFTLYHYVSHPITLYPPSHPVLLSTTLSLSTHRLCRSPPRPSKSDPHSPPNTLFRRTHGPSPILLYRTFLLTTPVKFELSTTLVAFYFFI